MGSAKKKLRKLNKRLKREAGKSVNSLRKPVALPQVVAATQAPNPALMQLRQLSEDALGEMAQELAAPLNPILSWFDGAPSQLERSPRTAKPSALAALKQQTKAQTLSRPSSFDAQPKVDTRFRQARVSAEVKARVPLNSPPCKKCPALKAGLCKCAMKKYAA